MSKAAMIRYPFRTRSEQEMQTASRRFLDTMRGRRSVRHFQSQALPMDVVERCIEAAALAPSGANKQPWTFVLVTNPAVKKQIREAAEQEERAFYGGRATESWLRDVAPFGTDENKPFLEDAPALIAIFAQRRGTDLGARHYYVTESVGIALGILLAALQHAGIAALTHTPAPMKFLAQILDRPSNETAFMLLPIGYPTSDCTVPDISRKPLSDVLVKV
ncbi:MAG TPA: nitroreductase family protein [Sorangium sp.]|nr:nitroreductase family protein [Sorangium sp.]